MKQIQESFPIIRKTQLTKTIWDIEVAAPPIVELAHAGQFVHIRCGEKTLRRPVSICSCDDRNGTLRLVFEVRGEGTQWLAQQQEGGRIDLLGPLGNGFPLGDTTRNAIVIGGGIGVPPLLETARAFGRRADAILGFRSADAVILEDDFRSACGLLSIATDDGSVGTQGLVTDVLRDQLAQGVPCDVLFACGPRPMLQAVSAVAAKQNIPCYVSLEERMGCGVGACLVCACQTQEADGLHYRHVCKDGPVFPATEVVW